MGVYNKFLSIIEELGSQVIFVNIDMIGSLNWTINGRIQWIGLSEVLVYFDWLALWFASAQ